MKRRRLTPRQQVRSEVQVAVQQARGESDVYQMLSAGLSPSMVAIRTGLTVHEVEAIRQRYTQVEVVITAASARDLFRRAIDLLNSAESAVLKLLESPDVSARDVNAAVNVAHEMREMSGLGTIKSIVDAQTGATIDTEVVKRTDVLMGMAARLTDTSDA